MLEKLGLNGDYKAKDIELWRQWKRTKSPMDLQKLLDQMNPIIAREVNRWAGGASRSFLEMRGKQLAVEAFGTYDPSRGAALSTHLASRLQKLSRDVYSTQNIARVSETNALLWNTVNSATTELRDELGRDPTHSELSHRLGWSHRKLEKFQRQMNRKEFVESEEHPDAAEDVDDYFTDFIYHDLTPLQQKIFEYSTGYRGAPKLSGKDMLKKLNITQGQLSYQKSLIVKVIEKAQGK